MIEIIKGLEVVALLIDLNFKERTRGNNLNYNRNCLREERELISRF